MAGPRTPQWLALLLWSLAQGRSIVDVEGEAGLAAADLEEEPDKVKPNSKWAKVTPSYPAHLFLQLKSLAFQGKLKNRVP